MKVNYYKDTDSMYIDLSEKPSADSREISKGIVLDFDSDGRLVGIDIDTASSNVNLARVLLKSFPGRVETA
jgi:uncharacterized protein YuzE